MKSNLFYPTTYSPAGGFTATDLITNITYPDDLKNDIAYPYYMGYILEKDLPLLFKPKKFVQDENQIGLYHLTDAFPAQNYSWLYMLKDQNASWNGYGNAIYKDLTDNQWKYLTIGYQYVYRFINAGMMANLNLLLTGVQYKMMKMVEDTVNETFTFSAPSTMTLTYNQIYDLIYNNGTITYSNVTFSQSDFDSETGFYKQVDQSDSTKINYIAFLDIQSTMPTYKAGGSPNIQIKPFLKFENSNNGEIAYITPNTINADHRIWVRQDGDAYDVIFNNIVVGGTYGNMLSVYDYIFPNCEGDIDIADLYTKQQGYYYQVDTNKIFYFSGRITYNNHSYFSWMVWQPINPVEFLKYFNLYNKYTSTNNSTYTQSSNYFTGLGVNYFNDDNVPLWTGKTPTDTYTYVDILSELQPWQLVGVDISANHYDDADKPDPDEPTPGEDDPLTKPNDPGKREDKIIGDRTGSGGATRITPQSGIQYYVMTGQELVQLRSLVWAQTKDFYSALNIINTEGTDTIFNYISSLRFYPFSDITNFINTSSTYSSVVMGTGAILQNTAITPYTDFTLRAAVKKTFQSMLCYWNLSDLPWRNNFLDFTPYSKLVVTIPYCGDVELDLNRVAAFGPLSDTVLWLWASGDIDSGTITFSLFTGAPGAAYDQILYSKNVKVAIDLPLSGNDQISQSNAILQATYNQASKVLSVGSSLIGEGISSVKKGLSKELSAGDVAKFATDAVQGVMDVGMASAEASLAKRQVPVSIGDINGTVATTQTRQYPYLTLYRQKTANPANYGHTTGFTCEAAYTLRELSGFTVLSNPDLRDVSGATQEELEELMGILTTGFYI